MVVIVAVTPFPDGLVISLPSISEVTFPLADAISAIVPDGAFTVTPFFMSRVIISSALCSDAMATGLPFSCSSLSG
jgi:hypothetical protein